VRLDATSQLRSYPEESVIATPRVALKNLSCRVVAAALRSLAKADSANARHLLVSYVDVPFHRNIISASGLRSLATVDTVRAVKLSFVKGRNSQSPEVQFAALGILNRYGRGRKDVVQLLEGIAGEKHSFIRTFALRLLGDLDDEEVLPALEKIAADVEDRSSLQAKASV
jgi:vesicle coat complex subunit